MQGNRVSWCARDFHIRRCKQILRIGELIALANSHGSDEPSSSFSFRNGERVYPRRKPEIGVVEKDTSMEIYSMLPTDDVFTTAPP